jgi:hypothetical protein
MANLEWWERFQEVGVFTLAARTSDHHPIHVCCSDSPTEFFKFQRSFKFEDRWTLEEECGEVIRGVWESDFQHVNLMAVVQGRLSQCQRAFTCWSRRKFGKEDEVLKRKTKELAILQGCSNKEGLQAILILKAEIYGLMEGRDRKWKQRAKQSWYSSGDRNTAYFHAWASHRKKMNRIAQIVDEDGRLWKKGQDVSRVFVDYYILYSLLKDLKGFRIA